MQGTTINVLPREKKLAEREIERDMDVKQVICMNKGEGENSYAKNSVVQRKIISQGRPVIEEAILDFFSCSSQLPNIMGIADLGCSSGPNTLSVVSMIIEIVCSRCSQLGCPSPEFQVFINDLPGNDFNTVFRLFPEFYHNFEEDWFGFGPCFVSATPGSFYGRLFPSNSLHFVHSSSSLHWLSQVPPELESKAITPLNKSYLYISKSSPSSVLNAYSQQFEKDFSLFLRTRSKEVVPGGRMILSFVGRRATDICSEENCYLQWELLAQALRDMVSEGLVKEEKLDSFNVPYYSPCPEEVEREVQKEGSFTVDRLQILEVEWDGGGDKYNGFTSEEEHKKRSCRRMTETIRAVVESMLSSHFGVDMMDDLFWRFNQILNDVFPKRRLTFANLVISMTRKA